MDYSAIMKAIKGRFGHCYNNSGYYSTIGEWLEWYKGFLKSFHVENVSNGITVKKRELYTAKMAKRVCEDWASSILSEPITISVSTYNKKSSVFVQGSKGNGGVLGSNNFVEVFARTIEQMFALGTAAFAIELENIGVDEEGNIALVTPETIIKVNGYNATRIIPISWSNGIIKEVAFVSEIVEQDKTYYVVSSHIKEADGYVIYNDILDTNYKNVRLNLNILPIIRTKSLNPLFYIVKTNIANNIDLESPMGVSVYANAIDNLKGCDITYDSCIREVITGQRIIVMSKALLATTDSGESIVPQDNRQPYMQYVGNNIIPDIKGIIQEFHPNMNTDQLDKEMQNQLNMLSSKVGLGTNYYKFDSSGGITATEYVGERNDFMRNAAKISDAVGATLKSLVQGILFVGKNILGANVDDNAKVDVKMPDGVVEDDNKEREQDRQDVKDGIMSKAEYRAKWYGETVEDAQVKIDEINGVKTETDKNNIVT